MTDTYDFSRRHIGPSAVDIEQMLNTIGVASLDVLVDETIPAAIRRDKPLTVKPGIPEHEYLAELRKTAGRNKVTRPMIGLGYHGTVTPPVILRNVLENPGWYTPYTPYQAEIAQGRLEALLNFQTMVTDLTGMDVANASLLDEPTAAAEAMTMLHRIHGRTNRKSGANRFFVADTCFPQTIDVLRGRAEPLGIDLEVGQFRSFEFGDAYFGALLTFPDANGNVSDCRTFIERAHGHGMLVAVSADLLSLTLLTPPGEMGADVVFGSAQRFGVPMGYGGPHAAFFTTREAHVREMPGRIIGVSRDAAGRRTYRMALQTREQHIRRDKAKSNICTAQALLANIAGFYAVYHGPEGLRQIALRIHAYARILDEAARGLGFVQKNTYYFDGIRLEAPPGLGNVSKGLVELLSRVGIAIRAVDERTVAIFPDETTELADLKKVVKALASVAGGKAPRVDWKKADAAPELVYHEDLIRTSPYLQHPVFHRHRSETAMMRYLKGLEDKDLGLNAAMIPLGSCTMKLNAAAEMIPITWPAFADLHPFAPVGHAKGYAKIFGELEKALADITELPAVSLQPNAGSQGEFAGLMVIRAYHHSRGDTHRNVVLIPSSAHGTNPASAVMAGMDVVVVACDDMGGVDMADLKKKIDEVGDRLAALMVTYPSTYGVFEDEIRDLCALIHEHGGLVYMDGANLNAQVGLTSPARIGADVCHINLHKTFSIPHGGGGPGMGPICAAVHLAPFMPGHALVKTGGDRAVHAISGAPWGSALILLISHGYIRMLGRDGMTAATRAAILNANYIKARLEKHYPVHYTGSRGRVAHELIFDLRGLKDKSGIDEQDIAKRLMDFGFHAPTVSWPIPGTLMVEPTESEPKEELDRFCDAMIVIREEIEAVIRGDADRSDNPLKNAPHTAREVCGNEWTHAYTREQAAYPVPGLLERKFWPAVGRVDNPFGDRNLVCSCPPVSEYT